MGDARSHVVGITYVPNDCHGVRATRFDFTRHTLSSFFTDVVHDNVGTLRGEGQGNGPSNARTSSGDERGPSFEFKAHYETPSS
jgi:hypothetical protein